MKLFSELKSKVLGVLIGLSLVGGLALATATYTAYVPYVGISPTANGMVVSGDSGVPVHLAGTSGTVGGLTTYATTSNSSGPAIPALVVTGTNCANGTPAVGGDFAVATYTIGTGTTGCIVTITNLPTAPTAYQCYAVDQSTATGSAFGKGTANGCVVALGTTASADVIVVNVSAY